MLDRELTRWEAWSTWEELRVDSFGEKVGGGREISRWDS